MDNLKGDDVYVKIEPKSEPCSFSGDGDDFLSTVEEVPVIMHCDVTGADSVRPFRSMTYVCFLQSMMGDRPHCVGTCDLLFQSYMSKNVSVMSDLSSLDVEFQRTSSSVYSDTAPISDTPLGSISSSPSDTDDHHPSTPLDELFPRSSPSSIDDSVEVIDSLFERNLEVLRVMDMLLPLDADDITSNFDLKPHASMTTPSMDTEPWQLPSCAFTRKRGLHEVDNTGMQAQSQIHATRKKSNIERGHRCSVCGFTTSRRYDLRMHMYVHSDSKPHVCSLCHKSYARPYSLVRHRRSVHGV